MVNRTLKQGGTVMPVRKFCVFGDGIAFGVGDDRPGGWPARIGRREMDLVPDLQVYNMAVPWHSTADIVARWRIEAEPRVTGAARCGVVFQFGFSDTADVDDQGIRVPLPESLAHAEKMINDARHWRPVLWIGPPPMLRSAEPREEGGHWVAYGPARLAALNEAFSELARELKVPYLDLCDVLGDRADYRNALIDGDGVHPAAAGYAVIAEAVAQWEAWKDWFPRPEPPKAKPDPKAFQPLFFKKAKADDRIATAIL
ncbi:GDSL-type esterase/lipase family protein [Caenispirillum salinarum]|uniref:GDSL-type esterase/lipase family protein n=1 Tax=Caenispirillum salinarum TaxID=859058 RepID=UPI00384E6010